MNSEKKISAWWNSLLCFLFGHSLTYVCNRCGKVVDLKGKKRDTLEDRINAWYSSRKKIKKESLEYRGSLAIKPGLIKYELNLAKNTLRRVPVIEERETVRDKYGRKIIDKDGGPKTKIVKRKAQYDACCIYLDAMNDTRAIEKANNYLFGRKRGVLITQVEAEVHIPKNTLEVNLQNG